MTDSTKRPIFSQESWEQISSPEEFDQLIQVVTVKDWLSFAIFGGLVLVGISWSIFGKIPITVTGKGVLIRPRQVVEFQSAIQGNLESLKIRDGDCVKKDDVLATIDPSQLKKQLELQQQKLILLQTQAVDTQQLESQRTELEIDGLTSKAESLRQRLQDTQNLTPTLQNNTLKALKEQRQTLEQRLQDMEAVTPILKEEKLQEINQQRTSLEKRLGDAQKLTPELRDKKLQAIAKQKVTLQQRLENAKNLTPILRDKNELALQQQQESLQQRLKDAQELVPVFQKRLTERQELFDEGAISQDNLLQTEQDFRQNLQSIAQIEAELRQLEVQEAETTEKYLQNFSNISEIEDKIKDLELEEVETNERYLDNINTIREIETELQALDSQTTETSKQFLDNLNQINEIKVQLQQVKLQETEAMEKYLENQNTIAQLKVDLQDLDTQRKRLEQENLKAVNTRKNQIAEVNREIAKLEKQVADNSKILSPIDGCILEIKSTVGQYVNPGTSLGKINVQGKSSELVAVSYFPVKDGKRIKSDMEIQITPDTVKRERFGGIIGNINSISNFPVTKEGASFVVGNPEVVENIIGESGGQIEAYVQLKKDDNTFSGYEWSSSKGPQQKLTAGTTITARVRVEERAPITFVLPILREWTGI
ncbi:MULTISPECIES: NHLP bacteriocin system secretion protein [Okeania]|uniref:NHLP bacteriocin system secretion protein n=1 Tax=Okeania hirsuta TaxID=1458930 RepID=A0A3N6Q3A7_9CYAN|nr:MULTISPECIES: NHLP bacteriocin system secretion protein [Okeania]NES91708.1 NHLP bacteriocin system secretion protein [Okeania sp. SIO2B9]RQH56550.1 NHLP bacteriocin system secretion protein [Okeania hirsuta]